MGETNADADDQPVGETCLSFTVRGEWGHFRRVEGNIVKQTYRLMPRTTIAGLLAGVLGIGRDNYYDLFAEEVSAIAIEPRGTLRTMNIPQNTLSTAKANIDMHPSRGHARIGLPDPTDLRQQHNYEMLVEPEYRIDCWLDDEETYANLRRRLRNGESYYTPSLGLSECLASITYHGEHNIESADATDPVVDSAVVEAVDSVVLDQETPVRTEQSPGFMRTDDGGRVTTDFVAYGFSPRGDPLTVRDTDACVVGGRKVMFS
ncbi:type I-B CRISPR-associated protein Cas5b [Haloarcula sp. JP-L23]|uniref:type I-B CRISPR-associated protein Cas5b n=1 Tax=Haloarcula sp. JP-L23 TaxID=2716717 RepID=UPI00140F3959|nr:type I-B CRISPR-associated protein Cas5 [Haloarcula sp. JP-L23]